MKINRAELKEAARELRERAATDGEALHNLCNVYWMLGEQDASVEAFSELLPRIGQPENKAFDEVYFDALRATRSCPLPVGRRDRFMQLVELLDSTSNIDGPVVECGCFLGLSSYLLCSFLQRRQPAFDGGGYHIFDSFAGLSEPTEDDEIPDDWSNAQGLRQMAKRGHFAASLETVKANLRKFPAVTYHAGWIPLTFAEMPELSYRFVHVDVDLYDPTLDAFSYFYPRLAPGGFIVSDDYSWPGARTAINEYCEEHRIPLQLSPVGQAIIRKEAA